MVAIGQLRPVSALNWLLRTGHSIFRREHRTLLALFESGDLPSRRSCHPVI
jgi:hypothetical protein